MKSLAELQALRDQMKDQMGIRHDAKDNIRVVVGMATCGIAAGARPVLQRLHRRSCQERPSKCHRSPDRLHRHLSV